MATPHPAAHWSETLNEGLKRHGLELYDFGDGVTRMPIPDFCGSGTYLTTHMMYVQKRVSLDEFLMLPVEIRTWRAREGFTIHPKCADRIAEIFPVFAHPLNFEKEALENRPFPRARLFLEQFNEEEYTPPVARTENQAPGAT